ncbi:hypothetical protein QQ054_14395 [Oscillatoria amoena NRMC-F 0135]|nr:hypothetical protein [Oscillatoria laete-virens]MDL5047211.1 hypothetical protein [Oscillatoria amoena NRMC-F 0135]MDL5055457.1 hypothetical protein [Oscillatoria laete-virens NRMC-F 0139]
MNYKKYLHIIGRLLSLGGIVFVVWRLFSYSTDINYSIFELRDIFIIILCIVVFSVSGFALALAWHSILNYLGCHVNRCWAIKTYGITQLAKYLPGNIFHLASRQALGASVGLSHGVLVKSSLFELSYIAFAASLYGIVLLPHFIITWSFQWSLAVFIIMLLFFVFMIKCIAGIKLLVAFLYQNIYLIISSSVFFVLLSIISDEMFNFSQIIIIICAYIIACLVGFLTPGAPAGLGVREVVVIYLLKHLVSTPDLLMAVVIGRAVNVLADFLFYLFALSMKDSEKVYVNATP